MLPSDPCGVLPAPCSKATPWEAREARKHPTSLPASGKHAGSTRKHGKHQTETGLPTVNEHVFSATLPGRTPPDRAELQSFLATLELRLHDASPTEAPDDIAQLEIEALDLAAQAFAKWQRAQLARIVAAPRPRMVHAWHRGRIELLCEGEILRGSPGRCPFPCSRGHQHRRTLLDDDRLSAQGWADCQRGDVREELERERRRKARKSGGRAAISRPASTPKTTPKPQPRGSRTR